jgi:hypothetical protein
MARIKLSANSCGIPHNSRLLNEILGASLSRILSRRVLNFVFHLDMWLGGFGIDLIWTKSRHKLLGPDLSWGLACSSYFLLARWSCRIAH